MTPTAVITACILLSHACVACVCTNIFGCVCVCVCVLLRVLLCASVCASIATAVCVSLVEPSLIILMQEELFVLVGLRLQVAD
jgi:hypothetical protein